MIQVGDHVISTGHGRTKNWCYTVGTVTKRLGDKVFVLWENTSFHIEEEMDIREVRPDDGVKIKNTLLCRHCGSRLWWYGELIDFNPLGFNQINHKIACVRCGKEIYYDIEELKKHEVNFVRFWTET